MKHFWALPAVLRPALVLASQHAFSVHDDLLAFPQYDVKFSDDYIPEAQAQSRLQPSDAAPTADASSDVGQYSGHEPGSDNDEKASEPKLEYEMMILDKQRYLCSIPQVEPVNQSSENATLTKAEHDRELARANDRGWELLSAMQGNCVYFVSGWWSYRFCYNDGVKQFHQLPPSRGMPPYPPVEDPGVAGYMLGKYEAKKNTPSKAGKKGQQWEGEAGLEVSQGSKTKDVVRGELVTRGESRYLVQKLEGGTTCDLTGKPRRIEIQVSCVRLHHLPPTNISTSSTATLQPAPTASP
jgi:protein OS-9